MRKLFMVAVVVVATLLSSCQSKYSYQSFKNDPLKARLYTLDNGLKVYMTVNKEEPRIQTFIAVKVGGKNDPAQTTGLAHYFEHLMFKGSKSFGTQNYELEKPLLDQIEATFEIYRKTTDEKERTALYKKIDSLSYEASKLAIPNEYDKLMSAIGASGTNAYTGFDQTVYVENIPSNRIEEWAKIQADRFENNVIRGFHTELETVYEEKNMSLTRDSRKAIEALLSAVFTHHPYGTQTVLGTQEHLKNPSITNIKNYHKTWYVPNNMAICLSGDFDPDEMIATIDKYFGGMVPNDSLPVLNIPAEEPITSPIVKEVYGLEAENVYLGWRVGGAASKDNDIIALVSSILFNGKAGLVDLNLVQKQQILGGFISPYILADHGMLVAQATPKSGQTLEQLRDLLLEQVAKLRAGEFDETLLAAAINNYKVRLQRVLDDNNGRADLFVDCFINGLDYQEAIQGVEALSKITKEDIVKFANENLRDDNYAIIYKRQGKDPNEMKISKPAITPIFMNRDTTSQFLRDIQASVAKPIEPRFVDFKKDLTSSAIFDNKVPLLYVQNPTNDIFTLSYLYETGANDNKKVGLAFRYLNYLGTSTKSPEQIKQEFYNLACSFGVSSSSRRSYVQVSGLGENMEKAMALLEELILDAQPNERALNALKADILRSRVNTKLNQGANFSALRTYAIYGPKNPTNNVLTNEELMAVTSEELLDIVHSLAKYEHRILYYGPMSVSEVKKSLTANHKFQPDFIALPEHVKYDMVETNENKVLLAHYDARQLYFAQNSHRGETFNKDIHPAQALYNSYFGSGMNSIVFQEMRESRGLAYSAYAALSQPSFKDEGYSMMAFIATQNDKMLDAIKAFDEIINNMPESEAAFKIAKDNIISLLRTRRVIKQDIIWEYLNAVDLGVEETLDKALFEKVQTMTLEDVKAFHKEWIKDRKYTYSILGNEKDMDIKSLEKMYGPVTRVSQKELFGY